MTQSTARASEPPDCFTPAFPSESSPSAETPGVGNRQAESCRRPSGYTTRGPSAPSRVWASMRAAIRSNAQSLDVVSSFST